MSRNFKIIFCTLILSLFGIPLYLQAQVEFIENKGQWPSPVNYRGDFNTGSFFLEDGGFTVLLHQPDEVKKMYAYFHGELSEKEQAPNILYSLHSFAYKMKLSGARKNVKSLPEKPLDSYNNYFIGNDKSKWASDCKIYYSITYPDIYPNIDVRYYSNGTHLKYDFIVKPGGNVNAIAMQYEGPKLSIKNGDLMLTTPVGEIAELKPYSYQSGIGKPIEVSARYVLKNNIVSFKVDDYDHSQTLVIDPVIVFSSFSGSTADNWGYTATPGPGGTLYAGGIVFSAGYPVTAGAYDGTFGGGANEGNITGFDMGITKFAAINAQRLFSTYIGGNNNEQPHSLICDAQGNLYIAGRSASSNYPTLTASDLYGPRGDFDIVITKLNAAGNNLLGSVIIGGTGRDGVNIRPKYEPPGGAESLRRNYGDDARSEVILDKAGNVYVASCTRSTNFPVTPGAVQSVQGGGDQDGVILKFNNNLSSLLFSTYFGGNGNDACFVASINPVDNNLYIGGATSSAAGLLGNKTNVLYPAYSGGVADGFITILKNDGSAIIKTSYFGTGGIDLIYGLKFDKHGYPYIMGTSTGSWPVQNAVYSNPGARQFISKLKSDLSAFEYSTVFGTVSTNPNISPVAFLVDRCENVYVSGWGGGLNLNYESGTTQNLPEVNPLAGIPPPDARDFYFFVLQRNAQSQLFGSHFGKYSPNATGEHVDGGTSRFDENGIIYQAICGECANGNFPITPGAYTCNSLNGYNLAVVKIDMNFAGVGAAIKATVDGVTTDTIICTGETVLFSDTLKKGKKYYWDFGHAPNRYDTTTANTSSHLYNTVGSYTAMLIAEDSATCNIRDTSYITIKVGNNRANVNFNWAKTQPCESLGVLFTNTSTGTPPNFNANSFTWDYGDGSPKETAGISPPRSHSYSQAGTYTVILQLHDDNFCNSPLADTQIVRINPLVDARFTTSPSGCAPYNAIFTNESLAGTDFIWEYGDNTTSANGNITHTHLYQNPGTYRVRLIAIDTSTCNKRDTSAYFTIIVSDKPHAQATWAPNPPAANTFTQFTNQSTGASHYLWNFGDGESATEINPRHLYNATGIFTAELVAYNKYNCTDTFQLQVRTIIEPLLDVPNAFTPGKFGENASILVRGFGIEKMDWNIYNRWGQLIFHSENRKLGWDGTYKGKLQPMDVYTYTLDVIFSDGKKYRKTGDITLLR